jgi:membrane protease YdiL (CAAX protease family)
LRARVNFAVFAVVTVGCGWLFAAMDHYTGQVTGTGSISSTSGGTNGQGLWIAVPALVGVALYFLSRDGAGPLGLTLRFASRTRWFVFAGAFAVIVVVVPVLFAALTGVAAFSLTSRPGGQPLLAAAVSALPFLLIKNVLEEFIFRGYGTRTAMALGLRGVAPHLLVGLVWGLWHLPLYTVWMSRADFLRTTSLPWAWYVPTLVLGLMVLAVLYGELRARTGSIWPGVVLHTISNALANPLLINGHLTFEGHGDALLGLAPNSLATVLLFCGAALVLRRASARRAAVG